MDQSTKDHSFGAQLHQVGYKTDGEVAISSWPRSMAIALLSYTLSFQLAVMEAQAHPQAENIESYIWGLYPNSTVHFDEKMEKFTNSPTLNNGNKLFQLAESGGVCEETYGFLPCSTSIGGNLFLMLGYGYLLFLAAKFISDGSELLLEVGMAWLGFHRIFLSS